MKNSIRNLIITAALVGGMFGIANAQTAVSGEFSSDVTVGDATAFSTPYTGLSISGDGWELSTNLSDGDVNVEEAKYNFAISDAITATFGSQAEPYGIAWGSHRPSGNSFVSAPRDHSISTGVGVSTSAYGVGANAFYGDDNYWAARASYDVSAFGINSTVGLSVNSNDAQLIDVSTEGSALGIPYESSFEYDLANDGAYWLRGVVTPDFAKGAYGIIGYNSDEEVAYGIGYNASDNFKVSTELSGDGDTVIRFSYSF
jgi:hypothetical protein